MTIFHLQIAFCVALFLTNNFIFSRAYRQLTGKDPAAVNTQGLLSRPLNDWVKDPFELDGFERLSVESKLAADSIKQESARRNCILIAALTVVFITPRVIWSFPLIPPSSNEVILLAFCLISTLIDFTFWSRWIRTTYDQNGKLHFFSAKSIGTFLLAVAVTVIWHLAVKRVFQIG